MSDKDTLFEKLYDTYYDCVYRYIFAAVKNKWNAEDIIATVFTKIYTHREKIISVEESKNWTFRIAHNAIIDFYRKNSKVIPIEEFLDRGKEENGYEEVEIKDEFSQVKILLEQLPENTKDMIYMRYYGGLKFREIAEATDTPENTVKSVVSRGIKKIKKLYTKKMGGEISEGTKV